MDTDGVRLDVGRIIYLCTCGHELLDHFEGCCWVEGCHEVTGRAPCWELA